MATEEEMDAALLYIFNNLPAILEAEESESREVPEEDRAARDTSPDP